LVDLRKVLKRGQLPKLSDVVEPVTA
jgi:hypothetical protein